MAEKYAIALGTDTNSLEDPDQLVLVRMPMDWSDLDNDELIDSINEHWHDGSLEVTALVPWDDTKVSIATALRAEGLAEDRIAAILLTVEDAVDNA